MSVGVSHTTYLSGVVLFVRSCFIRQELSHMAGVVLCQELSYTSEVVLYVRSCLVCQELSHIPVICQELSQDSDELIDMTELKAKYAATVTALREDFADTLALRTNQKSFSNFSVTLENGEHMDLKYLGG